METQPQKGFTLIELVVTLIVVGVLAATAIPRFVGQQEFQSRAFFDQAQAAIKFAQKTAIAERRLVYVTISSTGIVACYAAACGGTGSMAVINPTTGGALSLAAQDARGVAFVAVTLSPATTIAFDGLGRPRDASGTLLAAVTTINVNSTVAGDINRAILIEPQTGYVHN
jgi:MSHA pilin protein MshC